MSDSRQPRLVLLEVSKVRNYHSTLVDGLIRAYDEAGLAERFGRPRLYAHDSFFAHLSPESRAAIDFAPIAVMDPDKGKRALKSVHEAWQVVVRLVKLKRNEVLFVTTVFPSAMILVEIAKWFMPGRKLVVLQHSELEGAFEPARFGSYPHLNLIWHRVRRLGSTIRLAVLDQFIARAVLSRYARSVKAGDLYVVPLPMIAGRDGREDLPGRHPRCCFVGYVTPAKGYETFGRLAEALPELDFHVIGGGKDRNIRTGEETGFGPDRGFLDALSDCDFAIMPYVSGYSCSLSAAATDAVASGLHLIATPRPCFVALAETFGPGTVSICESEAEMRALLSDPAWVRARVAERAQRLSRIDGSPYALRNVGQALGNMVEDMIPSASLAERRRAVTSDRGIATPHPEGQSR